MEIIESNYIEYNSIFSDPYHIFNSSLFNNLNKQKCNEVKYLIFKDKKYRLGLIGGVKNNIFCSPFSAPFGGFSFLKESVQISQVEEAIDLLEEYIAINHIKGIRIILPPLFYNEIFLAKITNILYRKGYFIKNLDLDFYINLSLFDNYLENIWYNARKNFQIAQKQDFVFEKCNTDERKLKEIYQIIFENRQAKGKPLNMSFDDVMNTSNIIKTDFFLLQKDGHGIASAIVFQANNSTMYVPFWGDRPGYTDIKPMNFISYKIFEYYRANSKRYVHIGISTEDSVPNYGLCEFKESIGCSVIPKFTFEKMINNGN